jgi:solute carrier family 8 (sodium/calcium exchanger)
MALGSSAPEILLSVIETVTTLGSKPGELGPSTIVGSAAFNLLVISGVSIMAVGDTPKKIDDMNVFAVTCSASFFAYIWLLIVLTIWTPDAVSMTEAILTVVFFALLIALAFAADRYTAKQKNASMSKDEKATALARQIKLQAKDDIQQLVPAKYSKATILEMVYGTRKSAEGNKEAEMIEGLFKKALDVEDLGKLELVELNTVFEPDNEIQQIRYKRAFGRALGAKRDFVILKGQVGQMEHIVEDAHKLTFNEEVGFKCLHYSVSEGSGKIDLTIENKTNKELIVGIKTTSDTALDGDDFVGIDQHLTIPASGQAVQSVKIIDDEGWEPDEDFFVHLYDINDDKKAQLYGDNTKTKVTILDDDKPGILQFKETNIKVKRSDKKAIIRIERVDGSDGLAECQAKNEEIASCSNPAKEFTDFLPFVKTVKFEHGVGEQIIEVDLEQDEFGTTKGEKTGQDEGAEKSSDEAVIFYIKISDPNPAGVHISKRNICQVNIVPEDEEIEEEEQAEKAKMIEFFVEQNDDSWAYQFKKAIILQPTIDEDDEIDYVTGMEAFMHFAAIGWKVLFATVPPFRYNNGWLAFGIALSYIGIVTAVVGEAANLFGCALGMK